jgi:hypothetical protein
MSDPPTSESHLPIFTAEEQELITALRGEVGERVSASLQDMSCLRFLRARKSNVELAATMAKNW